MLETFWEMAANKAGHVSLNTNTIEENRQNYRGC